MRGNDSFAYDLVVKHGGVNSRVALLLRSIEPKPFVFQGFPFDRLVRPEIRRGIWGVGDL